MRRLIVLTVAVAAGFVWTAAASAQVRPAPIGVLAPQPGYQTAQFRFPWESRPRAKTRARRAARPQRSRTEKPAATAKRGKDRKAPAAAGAAAGAANPLEAQLPAAAGPLSLAPPRGRTRSEADGWARLAGEIAPPVAVPPLSPDGPAPAPAYVLALLERAQVRDQTVSSSAVMLAEPDSEAPDRHIPLPPVRPSAQGDALASKSVPLPPRRPGAMAALEPGATARPEEPAGPTEADIPLPIVAHDDDADCRALASEGVVEAARLPPIEGPGVCGGGPLVSLSSVKRRDGAEVKINPAATLRCSMARELAGLLRDDVAPAAEAAGLALTRLDIAGSFQCRGRNGASSGKMSEHGRANAVDLSAFGFANGKTVGIFSPDLPRPLADSLKAAACERFSTVLGPGSDGYHEHHLHLDLQPRRSKAKLCQWDDPAVAKAGDGGVDLASDGKSVPKTAARRRDGAE